MTRVVLAKPRLLKWTTTAVTVVQFSSLCGPGSGRYVRVNNINSSSGRYVRVNIIRDQHKCLLKHHDDPDAVMLTQLLETGLLQSWKALDFAAQGRRLISSLNQI